MDGTFQMWCEPQHGLPLNIRRLKNVSWLDLAEEAWQEVITLWKKPLQRFAPGAPAEQETHIAVASQRGLSSKRMMDAIRWHRAAK